MTHHTLRSQAENRPSAWLLAVCAAFAITVGLLVTRFGDMRAFEPMGLPTASRLLNQFSTVVMTSIALIIPLSANLYTPKLVRVYVAHPLILGGLSLLLAGHTLLLSSHCFPAGHPYQRVVSTAVAAVCLVGLAGALPYLFGLSQFLRPSYFMPRLTRLGVLSLRDLNRGQKARPSAASLFDTIDVVANIALTGMIRGDRHLVLLALRAMNTLLLEFVGSGDEAAWRSRSPRFVPGLALEGQDYLTRQRLWPEAYVLAQMMKIMEMATKRQHEILAELAAHLVDSAQLAAILGRDKVVELHIMTFNTLMRDVIEEKDSRRFMILCYHYRLLIEAFHQSPERMHEATQHLIHYGHKAARAGLDFGMETLIHDMGELVLSLARRDEEAAVDLLLTWVGPLWQESLEEEGHIRKAGWQSLVRVHWEARVAGHAAVADAILWRHLSDPAIHREQLERVLDESRELHFEFNDRLMRFAYLSPRAREAGRAFAEAW